MNCGSMQPWTSNTRSKFSAGRLPLRLMPSESPIRRLISGPTFFKRIEDRCAGCAVPHASPSPQQRPSPMPRSGRPCAAVCSLAPRPHPCRSDQHGPRTAHELEGLTRAGTTSRSTGACTSCARKAKPAHCVCIDGQRIEVKRSTPSGSRRRFGRRCRWPEASTGFAGITAA